MYLTKGKILEKNIILVVSELAEVTGILRAVVHTKVIMYLQKIVHICHVFPFFNVRINLPS
jgi:hypothetical protein